MTGSQEEIAGLKRQAEGLSAMLQIGRQALSAPTLQALSFVIVNETNRILPYRQAVLWSAQGDTYRIAAISGLSQLDHNAPYMRWQNQLLKGLWRKKDQVISPVGADDVKKNVAAQWSEFAPPHGLWVPIRHPLSQKVIAGLWLVRNKEWGEREQHLSNLLSATFGAAMGLHLKKDRPSFLARLLRRSGAGVIGAGLVALSLIFPVRLSVLAPAEVEPQDPQVVAAPFEGVVDHFEVEPGQTVEEGTVLFHLEKTDLENRLAVASKTLDVKKAEYHKAAQDAFKSRESKARLAVLKAEIRKAEAEAVYMQDLLSRSAVKAPRAGLVLFADPNEWLGRPVQVGERVMTVADPDKVELRVDVPVDDAITFEKGADIRFFLNVAPTDPLPLTLSRAAFEPEITPDQTAVYRLYADFEEDAPRVGLKGTAKIYGDRVSFFYYVMRRPLAALRRMLGV